MNQLVNNPLAPFFVHCNRLARFKAGTSGREYWREHWKSLERRSRLDMEVVQGSLGEYTEVFTKYLKKGDKVLEAGCGTGYMVELLRARGFEVVGLDNEEDAIHYAKEKYPLASFVLGDITSLGISDNSLDSYISLGVLEHFENGMNIVLREAYRVLAVDGTALISVPLLNRTRKAVLRKAQPWTRESGDYHFYQFYFSKEEFRVILAENGFKVIQTYPLFPLHFLENEHRLFRWIWNHALMRTRMKRYVRKNVLKLPVWMRSLAAHMTMYVCKKLP